MARATAGPRQPGGSLLFVDGSRRHSGSAVILAEAVRRARKRAGQILEPVGQGAVIEIACRIDEPGYFLRAEDYGQPSGGFGKRNVLGQKIPA
jgi:hypothetical protein